jgi:hypothetical protein
VLAEMVIDDRADMGGVAVRSGMHPVGGRVTTCQEPFEGGGVILSEYPFSAGVRFVDEEEASNPSLVI